MPPCNRCANYLPDEDSESRERGTCLYDGSTVRKGDECHNGEYVSQPRT